MRTSFRPTMLVAAIAIGLTAAAVTYAGDVDVSAQAPVTFSVALSTAPLTYIVRFAEPGLLHYAGGERGIAATALTTHERKLDAHTGAAQAYAGYLDERRSTHLGAITQLLGRNPEVSHRYAVTMNGVAMSLTPDEAQRLARLDGVASVRPSRQFVPETYHGPEFIGAASVWNGISVPDGVGNRGEGVVVGDIDTGGYSAHPSFADDQTCGLGPARHKVLSEVDCSTTDAFGICNGTEPEADPGNGHGVHTASTAVGDRVDASSVPPPTLPPSHTSMSGVAPCAQLRTYKVCPTTGCSDAAIVAGIENAILDRVDVLNFSIGPNCGSVPGESPWSNGDEAWLDALGADIFVAASAGNTRAGCGDASGRVSNISPWVTTVAASTHDENISGSGVLNATSPGAPPPGTRNIALIPGSGLDVGVPMSDVAIRYDATNPIGCTANGGFPPGYFNDAVALIARGNCAYEEKINNAQAAGALVAVIYSNQDSVPPMDAGGAALPAYSIRRVDGEALVTFMAANAPTPVAIDFAPASHQGDVLAGFSLRGPDVLTGVTKPDVTAPGVSIYAALDAAENNYGYFSGTSMSSPHVAGSAALVRSIHPEWTPSEVKSALMLTAAAGTREDRTTPWTADDVGGGRVDLTVAARAGFVLDETYAHYAAADPAHGGDPKSLNLASLRDVDGCDAPSPCTWTRELSNVLMTPSSWTVSVDAPAGVSVGVDPSTFAFGGTGNSPDTLLRDGFDGGNLQTIVVTATTDPSLYGPQFADLVFHEANGAAPDAHVTVAVKGTSDIDNTTYGVSCANGVCDFQIDIPTPSFSGVGCGTHCGFVWLNRFTPESTDYPITLTSVATVFGDPPGWNAQGDRINVYVYQDDDSDPTNGAVLAGSYQGYAMAVPVNDFAVIDLPMPIVLNGPGSVLIALTNSTSNTGIRPASADAGPFAGRSWFATFTDNGTAPNLATVGLLLNTQAISGFDGNWMIRATGTNAGGQPIVLDATGD